MMNNTAQGQNHCPPKKLGEIFKHAGLAFTRLGELTSDLDTSHHSKSKWGDEEIDMLQDAVTRFSEDMATLSQRIKLKSLMQAKDKMSSDMVASLPGPSTSSHPHYKTNSTSQHTMIMTPTATQGQPTTFISSDGNKFQSNVITIHPANQVTYSQHLTPSGSKGGIPISVNIQPASSLKTNSTTPHLGTKPKQNVVILSPAAVLKTNADMTLSALNAMDFDGDM